MNNCDSGRVAMTEAEEKLDRLLSDDGWIMCKQTKDGSKVMKQHRANEPNVYLFTGLINGTTVEQVATLINPLGPYRIQWDTQLKQIELLERVDKENVTNMLKIRHLTHSRLKGLISERETVDLCRFHSDNGRRVVIMTDTTHPSDVPKPGVVRARTHLSALVIEERPNRNVNLTAILQASVFLFGLPSVVVESFFPKGIIKFFDDLRKASQQNIIKNDSYEMPPGW
ncbi:StAR-related lipid transfer protein 5 [Toxocara canis]|nr:StAR-related lipid transfer protein 5 [Toxocara canis]